MKVLTPIQSGLLIGSATKTCQWGRGSYCIASLKSVSIPIEMNDLLLQALYHPELNVL